MGDVDAKMVGGWVGGWVGDIEAKCVHILCSHSKSMPSVMYLTLVMECV